MSKTLVALSATAIVLLGVPLLYWGPSLHLNSGPRLLGDLHLPDGSRLLLVQRPYREFVEPYSVNLYRVYADGFAEATVVGFEDSYWWFGALAYRGGKSVDIRAFGASTCIYDLEEK